MAWISTKTYFITSENTSAPSFDWVYAGSPQSTPMYQKRQTQTVTLNEEARGLLKSVALDAPTYEETRDDYGRLAQAVSVVYSRSRDNDAGGFTHHKVTTTQTITYLNEFRWDTSGMSETEPEA